MMIVVLLFLLGRTKDRDDNDDSKIICDEFERCVRLGDLATFYVDERVKTLRPDTFTNVTFVRWRRYCG